MDIKGFFTSLGNLVEEKNKAYGNAWVASAKILEILFPNGIKPEQYVDVLLLVRLFDKLCRIANGNTNALGEDAWKDGAGYMGLGAIWHAIKGKNNGK